MAHEVKYTTLWNLLKDPETRWLLKQISDSDRKSYILQLMTLADEGIVKFSERYHEMLFGAPDDISPTGKPVYLTKFKKPREISEYVISGLSPNEQDEVFVEL